MRIGKVTQWMPTFLASILVLVWSVGPIAWMGVISFTTLGNLPTTIGLPSFFSLDTYRAVIMGGPSSPLTSSILPRMVDSTIVALLCVAITTCLSIPPGYAFSRRRFRGSNLMYNSLLLVRMIPAIVLAIPYFLMFRQYGLLDTHLGLALAHATIWVPLGVWLMKGFFDTIPKELEEQATIDGASSTAVLSRIILPLSAPGVSVVACLCFLGSFIEYMFALVLLKGNVTTLPLAIAGLITGFRPFWNEMAAVSLIALLPIAIFFLLAGKYIVAGFTMGAIKG